MQLMIARIRFLFLKMFKFSLIKSQQICASTGRKIEPTIPNSLKPMKIKINVAIEFKPMHFPKIFGSMMFLIKELIAKIVRIPKPTVKLLKQKE